jgi:phosphomannomutase
MTKYIFDVDGTLTPSRRKIDRDFSMQFLEFCLDNEVYLVTGSDRDKTLEQIGKQIYDSCKKVYNCSGNDVYEGDVNVRRVHFELPLSAEYWLHSALQLTKYPILWGNHIEKRNGLVNFSVCGRNATDHNRRVYHEWDKINQERAMLCELFNETYPDLEARIGGQISIDISPKGHDKSQILVDFDKPDELLFFGDQCYEGGNDYKLASHIMHHQVNGWEHTRELIS